MPDSLYDETRGPEFLHEQATWRLEDCIFRLAQEARNVQTQKDH